ncbi:MAG TPA: response regulator [Bryobacteraceae bacterium]|jgi:DNA-binding response OmpR family regulator|nr:response regulator [Bryobacteraceae bacterium]
MAGEPILIVDDTPVNLKLTRILLVNEGYKVLTAASAEEALELLRSYHPFLVLADIQLPGIDGLELTRRIKQNRKTRDISVVALTAFAMRGDEQRAIDAGCDGYITKPIDTRALGGRIREFLDRRAETEVGPAPPPHDSEQASIPAAELQDLRERFLEEGQEQARQWLLDLDASFDANDAARVVHQWIGAGGLLGYTAISRLSREVEAILLERPVDQSQLRESVTNLALAFGSPKDARDTPMSAGIVAALSEKRVALVGLPTNEAQRFAVALQRVEAVPVFFEHSDRPDSDAMKSCQVVVVHVNPEAPASPWLDPSSPIAGYPVMLVGTREDLLELDTQVQSMAREFLMDAWQPEEALIRLSRVLSDRQPRAAKTGTPSSPAAPSAVAAQGPPGRARVLIADDDPTVVALVRAALKNFGMDCEIANNGRSALEIIRTSHPHAAVLDVNMPGMDGYEVLAAIRAEGLQVHVILLTARQQESDVIRGFTLGADDYVVKPFGPMELVARLKRLLSR